MIGINLRKMENYRIIENKISTADGLYSTYHIQKQYNFLGIKFWLNYYPYYYTHSGPTFKPWPYFESYYGKLSHIYNSLETVESVLAFLNEPQTIHYKGYKIKVCYTVDGNLNRVYKEYFIVNGNMVGSEIIKWFPIFIQYTYNKVFRDINQAFQHIDEVNKNWNKNLIKKSVYQRKS